MFADQRRKAIQDLLAEKGTVTVNELTGLLNTSAATIRSDLNHMEMQGLLIRTHGGAIKKDSQEPDLGENNYEIREKKFRAEKQRIGKAALKFLQEGQCILLDASSTCFEFARYLKDINMKLTVVTSGISTAVMLKENPHLTVIIVGGIVRNSSNSVEGLLGEELLRKINIDILFTSAYAFNMNDGLTDFSYYEVELKRKMVAASHKVIALLDHSKIDKSSFATFAQPEEIDILITDKEVTEEMNRFFNQHGILFEVAK
ncbi:DeoR/GlpR family DNA-binding transcription regulator [Weizmannia coagulans]|nr:MULTISPECIES: DeoR/GlpR family DNA-binding transcription regulator [Heyndrickxia]APB37280.1 transcriptional regulator [Heyndrickxia coagulans]ATW82071.1 DeoR/GlpR transcriptional regulator [Heyndrickxia coagulans]KXT21641.1 transcriptional regulator [Heyndrickxia coagulans]MBT2194621.1 DeoR/GlpR family DNA-binding transcription regulator [Heyndrickxia coagulans]MBT2237113.1 DeoR/GlpR family DNA-binding transcription regulator [Heyndrickxia coagulans]